MCLVSGWLMLKGEVKEHIMKTAFLRMPQYLSVDYLSGGETDVTAPDL